LNGFTSPVDKSLKILKANYIGNIHSLIYSGSLYFYGFDYFYAGIFSFSIFISASAAGSTVDIYTYAKFKDSIINPNYLIS